MVGSRFICKKTQSSNGYWTEGQLVWQDQNKEESGGEMNMSGEAWVQGEDCGYGGVYNNSLLTGGFLQKLTSVACSLCK